MYFQCHGGDEEKNQTLYDSFEWSTTAPTRSVTDGAGCGYINSGAAGNRPAFEGAFTGNLRSLAVELHIFPSVLHPLTLALGELDLHVTLAIDGETVVDGSLAGVPAVLNGTPFPPGGNFGTTTRDVSLSVGTASAHEIVDWVWETSEVPAGIVFNGTSAPALPAG